MRPTFREAIKDAIKVNEHTYIKKGNNAYKIIEHAPNYGENAYSVRYIKHDDISLINQLEA